MFNFYIDLLCYIHLPPESGNSRVIKSEFPLSLSVKYPPNINYAEPTEQGMYGARNFYVTHTDGKDEVKLGAWHVLPKSLLEFFRPVLKKEIPVDAWTNITQPFERLSYGTDNEMQTKNRLEEDAELMDEATRLRKAASEGKLTQDKLFEEVLRKVPGRIVLYMHGNSGHRGAGHRVELYQMLQKLDCHVIAFDYRSYGDSSPVECSEHGLVNDALAMYSYIKGVTNSPVFVWGHSLGTGVATHFMSRLVADGLPLPQAVVLESPFSNIRDEVRKHPMSWLFRHLPWFNMMIAQPMYNNNLRFESDCHIGKFHQPVMIVHAEDDLVVPFQLGYSLYRTSLDVRGKAWGPVEFHRFEGSSHYGHKFLCRAPEMPRLVHNFFKIYESEMY